MRSTLAAKTITAGLVLGAAFAATSARADVIVSTIPTTNNGTLQTNGANGAIGFSFNTSSFASIGSIDIAGNDSSGQVVQLFDTSGANGGPGALLFQSSVNGVYSSLGAPQGLTTFSALNWAVTAGTKYWFVLDAEGHGAGFGVVDGSAQVQQAYNSTSDESGSWSVYTFTGGGYRINSGTAPVPEPASIALLGAGLAGLGAVRRRKAASRA